MTILFADLADVQDLAKVECEGAVDLDIELHLRGREWCISSQAVGILDRGLWSDQELTEAKSMCQIRYWGAIVALFLATSAGAQTQSGAQSSREAVPERSPTRHDAGSARMFCYEPTGLSLLQPYGRGKIPVVFIHGLWSTPCSWARMIESFEADAALRDRYQFWTFGYSTGDPLPYSAFLLRHNLDEVRRRIDPDGSDAALDRMVLVGHSMGGLLTKMMVQESGTRMWQVVSHRPVDELAGDPEDRDLLRGALIFQPRREVRRVVYIATPHHGSRVDQGPLGRLGSQLIRLPDPLRASYKRLIDRNRADFFTEFFRRALPTSVDELEWHSPILMGLADLKLAPQIKSHSIIADRRDPPSAGGSDGIVPYDSAHVDGVASELFVSSGHLCQDRPAVIAEVRRILVEHAAQ
jgi:pimeloyl-ACP methyl ester carboxylesterase